MKQAIIFTKYLPSVYGASILLRENPKADLFDASGWRLLKTLNAYSKAKIEKISIVGVEGMPDSVDVQKILRKLANSGVKVEWVYCGQRDVSGLEGVSKGAQASNFRFKKCTWPNLGDEIANLSGINKKDAVVARLIKWCHKEDPAKQGHTHPHAAFVMQRLMNVLRFGLKRLPAYFEAVKILAEGRDLSPEELVEAESFLVDGEWMLAGYSESMDDYKARLIKIGSDPGLCRVLINGESGTGKELVARYVHGASNRAKKKFVAVNCANFVPELVNSELFGHKKGSFSGAVGDRKGYFEEANGGTLFLDEIGELSLDLQARLLRVLQQHVIRKVGDDKDTMVDVRIISATNRDLLEEVRKGRFREDLYYRLAQVRVRTQSWRQMNEDDRSSIIWKYWYQNTVGRNPDQELAPEDFDTLMHAPMPGNIRQVQSLMVNHIITGQSVRDILLEEQPGTGGAVATSVLSGILKADDLLSAHCKQVLERFGGNKSKSAQAVGMSINTFNKYLKT
jgi:DNA-binding NtrC family response regulator